MVITDIKLGKRKNVLVYSNGELILNIAKEVFLKTNIKIGYDISIKEINSIMSESNLYNAKEKALNILSYRSHSKKQLSDKLKLKFGQDICDETLRKMESLNLVNDENYAKNYAQYLANNKYYSLRRIKRELSIKGIDREIISETLENLDIDEYENINKVICKKEIKNDKDKKRLIDKLLRLGYEWSQISYVMDSREG